jgi:hypothetical protein
MAPQEPMADTGTCCTIVGLLLEVQSDLMLLPSKNFLTATHLDRVCWNGFLETEYRVLGS